MAVLDDVADVLSTGGIAPSIYKSVLPSTPDSVVALFETGGPAPIHTMAQGPGSAVVERPHVQLLSRDTRADTARQIAQQSVALLDALERTVNGVRYLSVYAIQSPFFMSRDETGRVLYAVNFELARVPVTSS